MEKYEPKYKHDCDDKNCCKFIIHHNGIDYYTYGGGDGLLSRHSNRPEDNTTIPFSVLIRIGELK